VSSSRDIQSQTAMTNSVDGTANAQYTQWFDWMTGDAPHWRDGTAKSAAKKVPGRKTIVMIAMAFIDVLSFFADLAMAMLDDASYRVMRLKICIYYQ